MIRVSGIRARLGNFTLELSLGVHDGELLSVLGPSGSGKSTLLSVIAGFLPAEAGRIHFGDRDVTNAKIEDRNVGFVFQNYALFEHLSAGDNIDYGLKRRGWSHSDRRSRVREMLSVVELEGFEERRVGDLSGGERQRIALARALAPEPDVLLLDEPLSALDAALRRSLRRLIRRIQQTTGTTTIYVTHDQEEALSLSDRIAVLRDGQLEQIGQPDELYKRPQDRWTAEFLGRANCLDGVVTDASTEGYRLETEVGSLTVTPARRSDRPQEPGIGGEGEPASAAAVDDPPSRRAGEAVTLFFRPEWCETSPDRTALNTLQGAVVVCEYNGRGSEVTLDIDGTPIVAWLFNAGPESCGREMVVRIPPERIRIL